MKKVIIIAEAGVNHNGSLELAKQLIDSAAEAKADYVKFQTFKAHKLVSKKAEKAAYQKNNTDKTEQSQYAMLKKLEIPNEWHFELIEYANSKNIVFVSTGFDEESIDFLDSIGIPFFKIPSGEITNKPYLIHIASKKKPIILSTGMATLSEIKQAVDVLLENGVSKSNLSVLHCNTEYPTPLNDVNLLAMLQIKEEIGVEIGYSDHTLGIEVPIAAVALGAMIIEKHFTLDKRMSGPDHAASLDPEELKAMVGAIKNIEKAISGDTQKKPSDSEIKNIVIARKSIHLKNAVKAGQIISVNDLEMKRPGDGISPMEVDEIVGRIFIKDLPAEYKLLKSDLL
jgi:N,N'-diacetyllegionaminate synthase